MHSWHKSEAKILLIVLHWVCPSIGSDFDSINKQHDYDGPAQLHLVARGVVLLQKVHLNYDIKNLFSTHVMCTSPSATMQFSDHPDHHDGLDTIECLSIICNDLCCGFVIPFLTVILSLLIWTYNFVSFITFIPSQVSQDWKSYYDNNQNLFALYTRSNLARASTWKQLAHIWQVLWTEYQRKQLLELWGNSLVT